MCAQFLLKSSLTRVLERFSAIMSSGTLLTASGTLLTELPERVLPYKPAAVVFTENGQSALRIMQFSLIPSWSKEKRVKFATHNARLDTVDSKATWKVPFVRNHCIVPLSHFIEPIYTGDLAGNMVRFFPSGGDLLGAAAIFDSWVDKETDSTIHSFAIITDEPSKFVKETGHDRQPIFLGPDSVPTWLAPEKLTAEKLKEFLKDGSHTPKLDVEVDRPLKPGWEKRL